MSVLDVLGGLSRAAGRGYEGYGQDQQLKVKNALAQQQEAREAERDRVLNAVSQRPVAPRLTTGVGPDGKPVRVEDVAGASVYEPPTVERPKPLTTGVGPDGRPVRVVDEPGASVYQAPEKPKEPSLITGEGGIRVPDVAGAKVPLPGAGAAPRPPRAPSGEQEKSAMFYNMMKGATPDIDKALASGNVRGDAISAALSTPNILSPITQRFLNADEQLYLRGLRAFTAGQLRKETGAAFGPKEMLDVHSRLFEGGGDTPELKVSKRAAREQALETMRQSGLPALLYYESVKKDGLPSVDAAAEAADPGGGNLAPAGPKKPPTYEEWLKSKGGRP